MSSVPDVGWSNEIELMLACARPQLRDQDRLRAQHALSRGIDWPRLVRLAQAHGLLPLLTRHFEDGVGDPPPDIRAALHAHTLSTARRNLQLSSELLAIIAECARAGIDIVPLKGPVLAESVYGTVALRRIQDIDVLVRRDDLGAVSSLLTARGYVVDPLPPDGETFALDNANTIAAKQPGQRIHVEVHYSLVLNRGREARTLDSLAPRLLSRMFEGTRVWVLSNEDNIVYLCEHGAGHAWTRLEWICGAAELIRRPSVNWPRLRAQAFKDGATARVQAAVDLAATLLDEALPNPIGPIPARVTLANAAVTRRLIGEPGRLLAKPWESYRYQSLTDAGLSAALHRTWMTFAITTPHDLETLPEGLRATPLKYLARPVGLLTRWASGQRARQIARQLDRQA